MDAGSYRTDIELRQDAWLTATIPTDRRLQCTCQGGGCDSVEFAPEAFDQVFEMGREVLAVGGEGFASVLGSRRRGTLLLEAGRRGLRVALAGPRHTAAARQVVENARAGPVYARPIIDLDDSEYSDEGTVRKFSRVGLRAILVKATPNDQGHIPAVVDGVDPVPDEPRQRRIWL